jgi:ketosteroid isomerase-like protein
MLCLFPHQSRVRSFGRTLSGPAALVLRLFLSFAYTPARLSQETFMARLITNGRYFLLLALLTLTPRPMHTQESHPSDRISAQISAVLSAQRDAWNRGDVRAFMDGYWNSPDVTFSGSSGVTRGWQAVLSRYQQRYATKEAMGQLDFSELEIRTLSPSSAMVLGRWHLTLASGDVAGVFTLVFQHFPSGWKIIHDHTSQVPGVGH